MGVASCVQEPAPAILEIIENLGDSIALLDREWRYVYLNGRAVEMARMPADRIVGHVIWDLFPELRSTPAYEHMHRAMRDRIHTRFEQYYAPYDLWVEIDTYPAKDGLVLAGRDISERKRFELEATQRLGELQQVYVTAPVGLAFLDAELRYRQVNEQLASLNGVPPQDHLGRSIAEVIPEAAPILEPIFRDVLRTARPVLQRELQVSTKAHRGQPRSYRASYYPVTEGDQILGINVAVEDVTAQKIAETALRESERRYRTLFETTADGILIVNDTGRYIDVNESYCRILKATKARLIGAHFSEFIPPDRLAEAERAFTQLQAGSMKPIDFPLRALDGSIVELSWTASAYYLPGLYFCVCRDLTDRHRAEKALQAREQDLQRLLAAIPDVITHFGPDLRIRYTSPAAERFTGVAAEHYVGKPVSEIGLPEELVQLFGESLKAIFATGQQQTIEFDFDSPLIGLRHLVGIGIPQITESGEVESALTILRDVTDRKRAERDRAMLLEREQGTREAAQQLNRVAPILAGELDLQKLVHSVTEIATRLTGAEFGAFFHKVLTARGESYLVYSLSGVERKDLTLEHGAELFAATFRTAGVVRIDDLETDPRYRTPFDGHRRVRSYLAVPVISRSGEVLGGLFFGHTAPGVFAEPQEALVRGIAAQAAISMDNARLFEQAQWVQTELKRSNEDLRRANRDLETFAYSASHDLQEPLRNVAIYSQLLERKLGPAADAESTKFLQGILKGTERMHHLVEDLLSYSRAARQAEGPVPLVDAGTALSTVLQTLKVRIDQAGAKIAADSLPKIRVHEVHMVQLFQNLIGNALKYRSQDPPYIQISAERQEGWWTFSVADNGIGIDPKYRSQIFGLFKRLHSRDQYSGSGVGLAICQRIVDHYGGRIWADAPEGGRGSVFRFSIPDVPGH